ncbi:hypothetical protein [Acinetobacter sp.]|uniref:hypothetical protein n=1 Tax=Acinetobacter sp. TaxID=472 RepID=UPI0035AF6E5E
MERNYFESAMGLPFCEFQSDKLKKYSVLRFGWGGISEVELDIELFFEKLDFNIGVLEFSLMEKNDRIAGYFQGNRSLFFLPGNGHGERFAFIENNNVLWMNYVRLNGIRDTQGLVHHFFGMSRMLMLVSRDVLDSKIIYDGLFGKLNIKEISFGVRHCLQDIIDPLFDGGCCMVGSGLGGENYGGYAFDVFMQNNFT